MSQAPHCAHLRDGTKMGEMKLLDTMLREDSVAILRLLLRDSRRPLQEIGDEVGLSTTSCWNRIKRMEAQGVFTGYLNLPDSAKRIKAEMDKWTKVAKDAKTKINWLWPATKTWRQPMPTDFSPT